MAISRRFQAQASVSAAQHSSLVNGKAALLSQHIEMIEQRPNPDGTVTVTFAGRGLGKNAIPVPPACTVTFDNGQITIQPIE